VVKSGDDKKYNESRSFRPEFLEVIHQKLDIEDFRNSKGNINPEKVVIAWINHPQLSKRRLKAPSSQTIRNFLERSPNDTFKYRTIEGLCWITQGYGLDTAENPFAEFKDKPVANISNDSKALTIEKESTVIAYPGFSSSLIIDCISRTGNEEVIFFGTFHYNVIRIFEDKIINTFQEKPNLKIKIISYYPIIKSQKNQRYSDISSEEKTIINYLAEDFGQSIKNYIDEFNVNLSSIESIIDKYKKVYPDRKPQIIAKFINRPPRSKWVMIDPDSNNGETIITPSMNNSYSTNLPTFHLLHRNTDLWKRYYILFQEFWDKGILMDDIYRLEKDL
jgi:hypothetical protein